MWKRHRNTLYEEGIKERLSKLQAENNGEKCNAVEIDLPDIKFCDKINCFQMVRKSSDKETNTPGEEKNCIY